MKSCDLPLVLLVLPSCGSGFRPHHVNTQRLPAAGRAPFVCGHTTRLSTLCRAEPKKKSGNQPQSNNKAMSADMKRRLMQEAETPWRTVRQFFYAGFGLSATIGGLTALTQLAASASNRPGALPLTQSLTNVAVDLGVVAACAYGWRVDARAAADVVTQDYSQSNPAALTEDEAAERLASVSRLRVEVGLADRRKEASIETLRAAARQHVVIVGGPRDTVDDTLRDALIQQKVFAKAECLVVPVRLDDPAALIDRKPVDRAGFVALPAETDADRWAEYVQGEIDIATAQGATDAPTAGVVIAIRRDGSVARRGVGKPPWRDLVDELENDGSSDDDDDDDQGGNKKRPTSQKKTTKVNTNGKKQTTTTTTSPVS